MSKPIKKVTECRVDIEQLHKHLCSLINSPNRKEIAEVIITHLANSEVGINHLVLSMAGMRPMYKYNVGTRVIVDISDLSSWRINKEKTRELSKKDIYGYCRAIITDVDKFSRYPYKCTISCVNDDDMVVEESMVFREEDLHPIEDILSELSKEKDLPF